VQRDYDASIPEFRGDREQLIQAVLNIAHNATQALAEQIERGDARIVLRTRVARQVTVGKQRFDWHWNCISRTTGRACPRPSEIASSTRWYRVATAARASG
jgi:signal transduction histidine kinase